MTEPSAHVQNPSKPGAAFVSNHAMLVRLRGSFNRVELEKALDGIRSRHMLLIRAADSEDPAAAHFPVQELTGCAEADWQEIAKAELLKPFPAEQGPFARFILLRLEDCSELLGVFHHGVCDGMSGVYVMRDALRMLNEPEAVLPAIPRQPAMRDLIPAAVRASRPVQWRIHGILAAIRLQLWFKRLQRRWFPAAMNNPTEGSPASQQICILTETLTTGQTRALLARCKSEQTSLHAALCVAWLRAFALQGKGRKTWLRSVSSPISLRERLGIPDTSGLYLANATIQVNCAPGRDFWQTSRGFKEKLKQASRDENLFFIPLVIGAVFSSLPERDRNEILPILFNRPVKYDFSITNLGRVDLPVTAGRLEPEAFYNLVNASEHERTVCVNSFNGRLTQTLLFRASKMDLRSAESLMKLVSQQLAQAIGD